MQGVGTALKEPAFHPHPSPPAQPPTHGHKFPTSDCMERWKSSSGVLPSLTQRPLGSVLRSPSLWVPHPPPFP